MRIGNVLSTKDNSPRSNEVKSAWNDGICFSELSIERKRRRYGFHFAHIINELWTS